MLLIFECDSQTHVHDLQVTSGATFALYKPVTPPAPPTPGNFLENWKATKCNIVFCVPVFLEVFFILFLLVAIVR